MVCEVDATIRDAPTTPTGHPNTCRSTARKPLAHLTPAEAALYERLTDPGWEGTRRIEQERIPLGVALDAVQAAIAG